jgi:hypothetical protein
MEKKVVFSAKKKKKKKTPIGDPNQNPNKIRGKEKKMIMGREKKKKMIMGGTHIAL